MRKNRRNWFFDIVLFVLFFSLLEVFSTYILKLYYPQRDLRSNEHVILKFDEALGFRLRPEIFRKGKSLFWVSSKFGNRFKGKITFDYKEGMIRNPGGDYILNRWGFRGPYFEKDHPSKVFRIAALGASTTAGDHENELTYPRILERMLNATNNYSRHFQIINAGHWAYTSCAVQTMFERDILPFQPDMVLIMSGLGDVNLLRTPDILNQKSYCMKSHSTLDQFSLFRLSKFLVFPKNKRSDLGWKIYKKNLGFYEANLQRIITLARKKNIEVGFISLPGMYEVGTTTKKLRKLPQLSRLDESGIGYYRKVILAVNAIMRKLAMGNENVFFIHSGMSVKTSGKGLFFADPVHANGEGYRAMAYGVYKAINQRMNLQKTTEKPNKYEKIVSDQLEIEYLKSIFVSYEMEDISFAGCVIFHGKCTEKEINLKDNQFVTSVVSFVLGSMLLFRDQVSEVKEILGKYIEKAINKRPDFSLLYWVKGEMMDVLGESGSSETFEKAYRLNPKLRNISFEWNYQKFIKRTRPNPFMISLSRIIEIIKVSPSHIASYVYYWSLKGKEFKKRDFKTNLELYLKLYYLSPLLVRSIFEDAVQYLIEKGERNSALELCRALKKMKPEYDFDRIFSSYENKILKKTTPANFSY